MKTIRIAHWSPTLTVTIIFMLMGFISESTAAPKVEKNPSPKTVVLGTAKVGMAFYVFGAAFAKVITTSSPLKVEIFPETTTVWFPMLQTGEVHFGVSATDDALAGYLGKEIYEKPSGGKGYPLRTLMLGPWNELGMVVPATSDIKTMQDLKGKKVPTNYANFFAVTLSVRSLLANAGLTVKDVNGFPVTTYEKGVQAVIEGRADSALGAVGTGIVEELKATKGARYLPLDTSPEAIARMKDVHPGYFVTKASSGPAGLATEMDLLGKSIGLYTYDKLKDDVAYEIVKVLWEHYEELGVIHPRLKNCTPNRFAVTTAVVPYHSGAIKLYKEKGVWTKKLEDHQQKLLAQK